MAAAAGKVLLSASLEAEHVVARWAAACETSAELQAGLVARLEVGHAAMELAARGEGGGGGGADNPHVRAAHLRCDQAVAALEAEKAARAADMAAARLVSDKEREEARAASDRERAAARAAADVERAEARAALEREREALRASAERDRASDREALSQVIARAGASSDGHARLVALAERMDARDAALRTHLEAVVSVQHAAEVQRLHGSLAALQAEYDRVCGTNHVKGVQGEAHVLQVMQREFADWEVADTSARGAMSDLHLTTPDGSGVLVVEVKNKGAVTVGDVEKSMRDVRELTVRLGDRFMGYLFVSLRTRNIPRKGGMMVELVHGVPVMWAGWDAECAGLDDELAHSARALSVVSACLATQRRQAAQGEGAAEAAVRRAEECVGALTTHMGRVDTLRQMVSGIMTALDGARRHSAGAAALLDAARQELDAFVMRVSGAAAEPAPPCRELQCSLCGKVCSSRGGLTMHMRSCSRLSAA